MFHEFIYELGCTKVPDDQGLNSAFKLAMQFKSTSANCPLRNLANNHDFRTCKP